MEGYTTMLEFGQRLTHSKNGELPKSWKAFRKYDGHSVIWLPHLQELWSIGRSAGPKLINTPVFFRQHLPDYPVHGELWHPSDQPQMITAATTKIPQPHLWAKLKLVVFAFPADNSFVNPLDPDTWCHLESVVPWDAGEVEENKYVMRPEEVEPTSVDLAACGWEGLVFQNPKARYKNGRTKQVQKHKPEYDDEAIVIGYAEGKTGARVGTCGGLIVEWSPSEKTETIHGFTDACRGRKTFTVSGLDSSEWNNAEETYPIGTEIKFKFLSISNLGTPMHCSIYRSK